MEIVKKEETECHQINGEEFCLRLHEMVNEFAGVENNGNK
jgi:hypothetical protein